MNFSHLLHSSIPQEEKLIQYGFSKSSEEFILNRDLKGGFYTEITITSAKITAQVFESETDEKYALIDVPSANGSFVNGLREQISKIVEEIHSACFICGDLKDQYVHWIAEELGVAGDYPWEDDDTSAVFRCQSGKWFALVMHIKFKNLGFASEDPVWAVNLKADAEKIPEIVDKKSIFPAWHMNKKYWITVVLTAVTDFEKLKALTLRSKELVEKLV